MKFFSFLFVISVLVVSCAPSREIADVLQNTHDKPPGYQHGFMNGCSSGFQQSGFDDYLFFKDILRYQSDEQYRKGWQAGLKKCFG